MPRFRQAPQRFPVLHGTFQPAAARSCSPRVPRAAPAALAALTFPCKLQLLTTAARSGCGVNMSMAWDVVRPCLLPDLLPLDLGIGYFSCGPTARIPALEDPGSTAVRAGHLGMLRWMVRNSYPLRRDKTLVTAAQHCGPAQLQDACDVLWELVCTYSRQHVAEQMAHAACAAAAAAAAAAGAPSPAPDQRRMHDAQAKVGIIMQLAQADAAPERRSRLLLRAAEAAAEASDMELLQWLVSQGLKLTAANTQQQVHSVLATALCGAHLEMADWLVAQTGLDQVGLAEEDVAGNLWCAAAGGGHVHSMRWLLGRGVVAQEGAIEAAALAGHLEAVRFLHEECRQELSQLVFGEAVVGGSVEMTSWLLQRGCPVSHTAHVAAARHEAMTRWLVAEEGCPAHGGTLGDFARHWHRCGSGGGGSSSSWTLLQAVKTILDDGHKPEASALHGAAEAGDLELMRYLQERYGLPYGEGTLAAAARGGCEEVVEWLVVQGGLRPGECWFMHDPHTRAALNGDLSTLQLSKKLGVAWAAGGKVLANMDARECLLPTLRWLAENCCGEGGRYRKRRSKGSWMGPPCVLRGTWRVWWGMSPG